MNETNLGKIHIFPDKESYRTNIDSVGADDLALVPFTNLPIGTVLPFSGNSIPAGYLPCNGSAISRTTYADLWAVIGTTYGSGDGSTTFNLPNLTDKFIQGSDTVGTVKSAGLPNITGHTWNILSVSNKEEGALSNIPEVESGSGITTSTAGTTKLRHLYFDASKSNAIYGNSDTVQPPALTMRYIIKY